MEKRPKLYYSYLGNVGKVTQNIINRDLTAITPLQKWTTSVSQLNFYGSFYTENSGGGVRFFLKKYKIVIQKRY